MVPHGITPGVISRALNQPSVHIPQDVIDRVVESLRAIAGWHITPVVEETLVVPTTGDCTLILPTKRVVEVKRVEFDGEEVTDFDWSDEGIFVHSPGFAPGFRRLRITLRHGFENPGDLIGVIAQMTQRALNPTNAHTVGSISVGASQAVTPQSSEWRVLSNYELGPLP